MQLTMGTEYTTYIVAGRVAGAEGLQSGKAMHDVWYTDHSLGLMLPNRLQQNQSSIVLATLSSKCPHHQPVAYRQ